MILNFEGVVREAVGEGVLGWLHLTRHAMQRLLALMEEMVIPFAVYDAMIFEALHYADPVTPEGSSPESDDFVFEYQLTPVLYD